MPRRTRPWGFASYPAALPHVIGVSAVTQTGSIPSFSNRDAVFNDLAAPGQGLVSTTPRELTAEKPSCLDQGYSICGPPDLKDGMGTSFSAAQVTAAAAHAACRQPEAGAGSGGGDHRAFGGRLESEHGLHRRARSAATRAPAGGRST